MLKLTSISKSAIVLTTLISVTFATPFTDKLLSQIDKLVYGEDNRLDYYQVQNPALLALADSTVALMKNEILIQDTEGNYSVTDSTFEESYNLCASEPFKDQINPGFCSGFLVGPDTIVTAGHCIENQSDCTDTSFVFGFNVPKAGNVNTNFSKDDVYKCKEILGRDQEGSGPDWAIIKLDREVLGRVPLKVRTEGTAAIGDSLVVIGHPVGLPVKISGGANVREIDDNGFFVANLDTYGGNSGSAVFNLTTKEVEGILVRGDDDFVYEGECRVSNVCTDEGCRGEDVTLINQVCILNGLECPELPADTNDYSDSSDPFDWSDWTGGTIGDGGANSCRFANDNSCDDGRPGSSYSACPAGTDENDCSETTLANSCQFANDNSCDDVMMEDLDQVSVHVLQEQTKLIVAESK